MSYDCNMIEYNRVLAVKLMYDVYLIYYLLDFEYKGNCTYMYII